jgi:MFS family permease
MRVGSERGALSVAIAGLLALASGMGIGRFVYTPILPAMIEALGLRPSEAGLIASSNFVGYLVGALLLMAPRLLPGERRWWFLGALVAGACSTMAMAGVGGVAGFAALRFVSGVASALALVVGSSLVLERLAAARAGWMASVHFAGIGAGIAVSALLVSGMEAAGFGWRALWLGAGVLSIAVVPVVAVLLGRPEAAAAPAAAGGGGRPRLLSLAVSYGLFGFGYVITATFLVAAVRASPTARPIEPLIWLAVGLTAIPSAAAWSWVAGRIGARPALGLALLVQATGVAAGGVWPDATGALIAAMLLGVTLVGINALGFAAARDVCPPSGLARAFALLTVAFSMGQVMGPLVAGVLLERTGSFAAPSLLAAAGLAVGAMLSFLPRIRALVRG